MTRPRVRLWGFMIGVAVIAAALAKLIETHKANRQLERLRERVRVDWQAQKKGIAKGRFSLIVFRYHDDDAARLTRDDAVRRLQALGPNVDEATIEPLFDELVERGWSKRRSTLSGTRVDVVIDGPKIANTLHKPRGKEVDIFDGTNEVRYRASDNRVTIYPGRTAIEMFDLDTIRAAANQLPRPTAKWSIEPRLDDEAKIEIAKRRVLIDRNSGFVKRVTVNDRGSVVREVVQHGPVNLGGITLPRLVAELSIRNDRVHMMTITLVKSAEVNPATTPADFRLGVPAGTRIRDLRLGPDPWTVRARAPLADVKEYAAARTGR